MEKAKKRLTIDMQGRSFTMNFEGNWNGNDVNIIMRHLPREYKLYNRDLRRKNVIENSVKNKEEKPISKGTNIAFA